MVIKPTRAEIHRMTDGNHRLTRAIELLFDGRGTPGTVTVGSDGTGVISFEAGFDASSDARLMLSVVSPDGPAVANRTGWITAGGVVTGAEISAMIVGDTVGPAANAQVDWLLV